MTVTDVSLASKGIVAISGGDTTVTYTSNNGTGADSFTYTINDGNGGSDTATVDVTVNSGGGGGGDMHIGDLDGFPVDGRRPDKWDLTVTIKVHDIDEDPVDGATVSGSWGGSAKGSGSCITVAGLCDVTKANIKRTAGDATFRVTGVTHASLIYASGANHEVPDGDNSDGTIITVAQP
jgi:hypothetical protein